MFSDNILSILSFFYDLYRKIEDNKCFTNICYRGQITVKKREILSKEHFSVLPLIVFGGIISSLLNTVVFTLSSQSSLSISVQLRSCYISKRFIVLCRLPGVQRSFHFDQEKKDHQHNHTKQAGKFVNLQHGCGEFPFKRPAGRDGTICIGWLSSATADNCLISLSCHRYLNIH